MNYEINNADALDLRFWSQLLKDAAAWGDAEEAECHLSSDSGVFSVRVKCSNDPMLLVEAGIALGTVQAELSKHNGRGSIFGARWLSIHKEDGELIESTR